MSRNTLLTELAGSSSDLSTPEEEAELSSAPPTATPIVKPSTATATPTRVNPFLGRPPLRSSGSNHAPSKYDPSVNTTEEEEEQLMMNDDLWNQSNIIFSRSVI